MPLIRLLNGTVQGARHSPEGKLPDGRFVPIIIIVLLYILIHLITLSRHPFVHSDEAWLASLTRSMMKEGSIAATEEAFRLTPRYPHAIKTLYHLIQMPFLLLSWSAYAARLPSLLAGLAALYFMVRIMKESDLARPWRAASAIFMALDPQFWYLSHLARGEMILITLLLASWSLKNSGYGPVIVALPLAAGIFIHPNSFIIALPVCGMFAADLFRREASPRRPLVNGVVFIGVLTLAAAAAIAMSLVMDPGFFVHYRNFGQTVGISDSLVVKLLGLTSFLRKMATGRAGTYYLPESRVFLAAGILGWIGTVVRAWLTRRFQAVWPLLLSPLMITLGLVIVGKYAPPTIGFLMPTSYLLLGYALFGPGKPGMGDRRRGAAATASLLLVLVLIGTVLHEIRLSYRLPSIRQYNRFIREAVGDEGRVLGNLNAAFALDYDRLVIWRDLENLSRREGALSSFLNRQDVRWVLLPDELSLIYSARPVWNQLYGNPYWFEELTGILDERGTVVGREKFPGYAMRIVPYIRRGEWFLTVYSVEE